jgi:hypothetical protein
VSTSPTNASLLIAKISFQIVPLKNYKRLSDYQNIKELAELFNATVVMVNG